ncbi:TPA: Tn3 family transposase [Enterococcus faecalis]|nr:Tn3 family transposase [Enterococcus faecium Ef_aus0018]HAQ2074004.1 Tn3 family transposase [Enterococcus faecium]HBI3725049.1 Tn3 family transposase [Enterococcus faecalis]HAQ2132308.1 Tn3 family transposase [Enterococcus faecium]HAZ1125469.1 Tn3 family transposase [Enterococcus faecium]
MKKAKRTRSLLNDIQRQEFLEGLFDLSEEELEMYYTLSSLDKTIIFERRTKAAQLGYAVQLCLLRYPGFVPKNLLMIPLDIVEYISEQIQADPVEFLRFNQRPTSIREHRQEIKMRFCFTKYSSRLETELLETVATYAEENRSITDMLYLLLRQLREKKVIIPALSVLESIIWVARDQADQQAQQKLISLFTNDQIDYLQRLLYAHETIGLTNLGWLKTATKRANSKTFQTVDKKLHFLKQFSFVPEELPIAPLKQREYVSLAQTYEASSLRELNAFKRAAILICFINHKRKQLIDDAVQIHLSLMSLNIKHSKKKVEEMLRKKKKAFKTNVRRFVEIGELLIYAKEKKLDPFELIQQQWDWQSFVSDIEEAKLLKTSTDIDYLDFLENKYAYIRSYSKLLLKNFEFQSVDSSRSLIEGIQVFQKFLESKKRLLPQSIPTNFLSERWKKQVFSSDGQVIRKYYELALLDTLNHQIRAGNVAVTGSERYKSFDSYLFSKDQWKEKEQYHHRLAVPLDFDSYIAERKQTLDNSLKRLAEELPNSEIAYIENDRIHIRPLGTIVPEEAEALSDLVGSMLPKIRSTDMLVQTDFWTNFSSEFSHASTGKGYPKEDVKTLYLAILALGTNLGLQQMADHTSEVSYEQLARVAQWYLQDENIEKANALLVNFHHQLPIATYWGDGSTSGSDGLRKKVPVSSLYANYDGKFGYEKDITIYRHSADQYQTYSTKIINSHDRDATHVLDGIIKNTTDLNITEHYTDTHGYTDQVFAFAHLLGLDFAPRIKNISSMSLYHLGNVPESLKSIIKKPINVSLIKENYQDILRVAHSIQERKVEASTILSKLGSYARKNSLAKAAQEMGKIEKTIFLANYYIDELTRRRVQKGLNKTEAINSLSRKVNIGKNDEMYAPSYEGQSQIAKLSDLVLNIIVVWNSLHMQEAIKRLQEKEMCPEELITHISPIRWAHIQFYGDYMFSNEQITNIQSLYKNEL